MRVAVLLVMATAAGCAPAPAGLPGGPTAVAIASPGAKDAALVVNASPEGAEVLVNGALRGASPLTLHLAPGDYEVVVRAPGYAPVTDTITLAAGQEANYTPELAAEAGAPRVALSADRTSVAWDDAVVLAATAVDSGGIEGLELLLDGEPLVTVDESSLTYTLTPADTSGMAPGQEYVVTARATNATGLVAESSITLVVTAGGSEAGEANPTPETGGALTLSATPAVTPTPDSDATAAPAEEAAAPADVVHYQVTEITIPTYPYAKHLSPATDPDVADYPLRVFDRAAYEASAPKPVPTRYRLLVLENRYLRLEILPDLGGRIYGMTFKPTGSEELYRNPVIKPTAWGPGAPPHPKGANWWLGAGGLEFGFPVEEHGYEFGSVWGFDNVITPAGGYMVSLFTRDPQRPHVVVDVTLEPGDAFFTLRTRIINPWAEPFRFKWWHDAMLAPGPENKVNESLRFVWPASRARIHSTGDPTLGAAGEEINWPVDNGRDLSRLGAWTSYLGVFESPAAKGGFAAVYDPASDEGVVRVYPPATARGAKFFATGWSNALDPANWTDDGSTYVEMQGGLAPTYDDWVELGANDEVSWTETWYPAAGIGGLTHAEAGGALRLDADGKKLRLGVFTVRPMKGTLTVNLPGGASASQAVEISPERPFTQEFEYSGPEIADGDVSVSLTDSSGAQVLSYQGKITLR
jgi:hypothetical protein